jgi:hypothetical protein
VVGCTPQLGVGAVSAFREPVSSISDVEGRQHNSSPFLFFFFLL